MKSGIHPQIYQDAKVTCSTCNTVFEIPSTLQSFAVEACRNCDPTYTGKQKKDVRGGRIDRFRQRMAKKAA